jgi:HTH-type transcriptional regulator, competence development regulator
MKSFGELVKNLRIRKGMLLREVAAGLQIDPSLLSRIERGSKRPIRNHVQRLAQILEADENELLITYLSDRVIYELQGEALAIRAMTAAEQKIRYLWPEMKLPPENDPPTTES